MPGVQVLRPAQCVRSRCAFVLPGRWKVIRAGGCRQAEGISAVNKARVAQALQAVQRVLRKRAFAPPGRGKGGKAQTGFRSTREVVSSPPRAALAYL